MQAALAAAHAQALYELAGAQAGDSARIGNGAALPQLYTEGFDAEQIWLQLDLQVGCWGLLPCYHLLGHSCCSPWILSIIVSTLHAVLLPGDPCYLERR